MPLIERERGSKTAPFTQSLPGARLSCVRHRRRTLYGVPGRFVPASVPCELVSKPLAASLLLTGCCGDLQATVVGGPQHRTVVTLRAGACSGVVSGGAALRRCAPKPIRCTAPQGCWGFGAAHWPKAPPAGALLVCASHWVHSGPSVLCDALGDRKTARRVPGGLGMMRFFGSSRCACRMLGEASPLSRWCNA